MKYFKQGNSYLKITNQSPKGFKGVVFVGFGPDVTGDISTVAERGYALSQFDKLPIVQRGEVPAEWLAAFNETIILLDPETQDLIDFTPVSVPLEHQPDRAYQQGLLIGIVIAIIYLLVR